jgi:hypothetical protein
MCAQIAGADSGPLLISPQPELIPTRFEEFIVRRDGEQSFSFEGKRLAHASISIGDTEKLTAEVYQSRGGKFIVALVKVSTLSTRAVSYGLRPDGFNKGGVFENIEAAVAWFRPGRLTDEIRKQLGLDQPIRID